MKLKNIFISLSAMGVLFCLAPACTNLDEELFSSQTAEEFYSDPDNQVAAVAPVYASLRNLYHHEDYWGFNQVTSDETIVPARGGDWYDGGKWLELNAHTWDENHPHLSRLWSTPYTGIARANGVLENLGEDAPETLKAEVQFLRAYYYFVLMDMFGGVPLVTTSLHDGKTAASSRSDVYQFIVDELESIKDVLPETPEYGRVGRGAAYAFLSKLYLNEGVYGQDTYTVVAPSASALDKVVDYTTELEGMGYALNDSYTGTFSLSNEVNNSDYVFFIPYTAVDGMGNHGNCWGVHYDTYKVKGVEWYVPSKWNGFSVIPAHYDSYDAMDNRLNMFYTEFEKADGEIVEHTNDVPLFEANKTQGVRVMKWDPDVNAVGVSWGGWSGNDFALIRFADVLLMHAEALARQGNVSEAMVYINRLRTEGNRFEASSPHADANAHYATLLGAGEVADELDFILKERSWELCWEGVRRQDLIRFGKYLDAWQNKQMENDGNAYDPDLERWTPSVGLPSDGAKRLVFPIPAGQISANPNLSQNEGY